MLFQVFRLIAISSFNIDSIIEIHLGGQHILNSNDRRFPNSWKRDTNASSKNRQRSHIPNSRAIFELWNIYFRSNPIQMSDITSPVKKCFQIANILNFGWHLKSHSSEFADDFFYVESQPVGKYPKLDSSQFSVCDNFIELWPCETKRNLNLVPDHKICLFASHEIFKM